MYFCNKCQEYRPLSRMTLENKVVAKLCKDCKNKGKRERNKSKKSGDFVNKNSLQSRQNKFLQTSIPIHKGVYTYERVKYVNAHEKVEIFCTKHQEYFWQSPTSHVAGNGCFDCGIKTTAMRRRYTKEEYIELASKVWGSEFDYSGINYTDCFTSIEIICPIHGHVSVIPTQHLSGRGCRYCAKNGYSTSRPGYIYILANQNMTKVGITNTTPEDRCKVISRKHETSFEVICSDYREDGSVANKIETLLLQYLKKNYKNPTEKFHGWTETFLYVDRDKLIKQLKEFSNDY